MAKDDWEHARSYADKLEVSKQLYADTFVFADVPIIGQTAQDLGYDSLVYTDLFPNGEETAEDVFGCEIWEMLDGDMGLDEEYVPVHETIRILDESVIKSVSTELTLDILDSGYDPCEGE